MDSKTINYFQPNMSDAEVVMLLKDRISSKTPFALTRFGDGEIIILKRKGSHSFLSRTMNNWGFKYPKEISNFYESWGEVLKKSFTKSDVVGVMNKNHNLPGLNFSDWVLPKDFFNTTDFNCDKLKICNHLVSRSNDLGSVEGVKNVIQGNDFHIISSNVSIMKQKKLNEVFEVNIGYTEHSKNVNFDNRDEFIKKFKDIKEDIVFLGVGLQKDYGVILRDSYGKVCVDMGATMDAWSGIISRPWFKKGSIQDHLLI